MNFIKLILIIEILLILFLPILKKIKKANEIDIKIYNIVLHVNTFVILLYYFIIGIDSLIYAYVRSKSIGNGYGLIMISVIQIFLSITAFLSTLLSILKKKYKYLIISAISIVLILIVCRTLFYHPEHDFDISFYNKLSNDSVSYSKPFKAGMVMEI